MKPSKNSRPSIRTRFFVDQWAHAQSLGDLTIVSTLATTFQIRCLRGPKADIFIEKSAGEFRKFDGSKEALLLFSELFGPEVRNPNFKRPAEPLPGHIMPNCSRAGLLGCF
jgi:hypothetical protein